MDRRSALKTLTTGIAALLALPRVTASQEPSKTVAECWHAYANGYGPKRAVVFERHARSIKRRTYKDQRPLLWRPISRQKDGTCVRLPTRLLPLDDERFHDRLGKAVEYRVETAHGREITYLHSYTAASGVKDSTLWGAWDTYLRSYTTCDEGLFWGSWDTTVPTRIQCINGLWCDSIELVRKHTRTGLPKHWLP